MLSADITLFDNQGMQPVLLDSNRDWIPIGSIDSNQLELLSKTSMEGQRFRLRSRYEHQSSGGPSTIQVRARNQSGVYVFTHPWAQSADSNSEFYSNWYEDGQGGMGKSPSIIEARLIAPPRTPIVGKLYSISMEAWTLVKKNEKSPELGSGVQLAHSRPLPIIQPGVERESDYNSSHADEALDFALNFIEASISGDLAAFYRAHSAHIHSLEDGKSHNKYRLSPPKILAGINSLDDYRRRFNFKLYNEETFQAMFPEWFDSSREWVPPQDAYLFMGHQDRLKIANISEIDYLVFMISKDISGEWKIIARPEF